MRRIWLGSLGLWLASAVSPVVAEELEWKAATLGKPIPAPLTATPATPATPRVTLGSPRASLGAPRPIVAVGANSPVYRGQDPSASMPLSQPRKAVPQVTESINGQPVNPMVTNPMVTSPVPQVPMNTMVPAPLPGQFGMRSPAPLPGVMTSMPTPNSTIVGSTIVGETIVDGPVLAGPSEMVVGGGGCSTGACPIPIGSPDGDTTLLEEGLVEGASLPGDRFFLSTEYLSWWTKGANTPSLATQSPVSSLGIVGQPGTTIIAGNRDLLPTRRDGLRLRGGWWCDPCQLWGIDGGVFFTNDLSENYTYSNNPFVSPNAPNALLARPFATQNFGSLFGGQFSEAVASAGSLAGTLNVSAESSLWGGDINARRRLWRGCTWNVDGLLGYRYLSLRDTISISESIVGLPQSDDFRGTIVNVHDSFRTTNHFHGGQIGLTGSVEHGRWGLDWRTTLAMGSVHQSVEINGSQTVLAAGTGSQSVFFQGPAQQGGLLALNSNSGAFSKDRFAFMPEVGLNLNYKLTQHMKCFVGYNFMYLSTVVRAADQIDNTIDINRVPRFPVPVFQPGTQQAIGLGAPGTAPAFPGIRPTPMFRDTDFWASGISFGLKFDW